MVGLWHVGVMFNRKELKMDKNKKEMEALQPILVRLNREQHAFLKSFSHKMGRSMSAQLAFVVDELKRRFGNEHTTVP
jgi:hypothetical protein